jgi:hypothetical protein
MGISESNCIRLEQSPLVYAEVSESYKTSLVSMVTVVGVFCPSCQLPVMSHE